LFSPRREGGHGVFTHSPFRPRFLFDETTMRPVNPATVHAVILSKEPMYNHIVDDTILHSGPRSSLLTRDDRRIVAATAAVWALTFLSLKTIRWWYSYARAKTKERRREKEKHIGEYAQLLYGVFHFAQK